MEIYKPSLKYASMSAPDLIQEASMDAMYQVIKNNIRTIIEHGGVEKIRKYYNETLIDTLQETQFIMTKVNEKVKEKSPYCMITLNFPKYNPEEDLDQIQKIVDIDIPRLFKKVWVYKIYYTLEFFNEKGEYTHPHYHIFVELKNIFKKKSHIIREVNDTLSSVFKIDIGKEKIDVKYHKEIKKGISYVKGTTEKKLKGSGNKKNKEWCDYYEIPRYRIWKNVGQKD